MISPSGPGAKYEAGARFVFIELFAGKGALSHAVGKYVATIPPQDLESGGTDFSDWAAVQLLWSQWKKLSEEGLSLIFHVAPPCASFSRARDRSHRTRIRSSAAPGGLYVGDEVTELGNQIARHTASSVEFLLSLGACGSWEQPAGSYMLPYLDSLSALTSQRDSVVLHQCLFGRPYRKPTAFWVFGDLRLPSLDRRCTPASSCGRTEHAQLGFGHMDTRAAATYPAKLIRAYVSDILTHIRCSRSPASSPVGRVVVENAGVVHRHIDRGGAFDSARAQRDEEDLWSNAGARNTRDVIDRWPEYPAAMDKIRNVLLQFRACHHELRHLADACGPSASRAPPPTALIDTLRRRVARKLGLDSSDADLHHVASPWRFRLVSKVMSLAGDPDTEVPKWLEQGTPVGIKAQVLPSGLLPLVSEYASTTAEKLQQQAQWSHNHPSFDGINNGDFPAHRLLGDLVDQGFALLFNSASDAEAWLGTPPVPSPLGDVTKIKPDGTIKHRLIQDLRASAVNNASCVGERQALPRFADHGQDLAVSTTEGEQVGVFILDFQNAFMTLPLHPDEMPFNTSVAPCGISRSRSALYPDEPSVGNFLVWRVLGFGGHSNPLTYSRAATFAARSGQALLVRPREKRVLQKVGYSCTSTIPSSPS